MRIVTVELCHFVLFVVFKKKNVSFTLSHCSGVPNVTFASPVSLLKKEMVTFLGTVNSTVWFES